MEHTLQELEELIASVRPLDEAAMAQAEKRQAYRVKVPGSLGRLEDISISCLLYTSDAADEL